LPGLNFSGGSWPQRWTGGLCYDSRFPGITFLAIPRYSVHSSGVVALLCLKRLCGCIPQFELNLVHFFTKDPWASFWVIGGHWQSSCQNDFRPPSFESRREPPARLASMSRAAKQDNKTFGRRLVGQGLRRKDGSQLTGGLVAACERVPVRDSSRPLRVNSAVPW